jgi:hypothetical protein
MEDTRLAFRASEHVGTRYYLIFAAQWLAYALPCRRFADTLAGANARPGAGADRYSFTVVDLHHLLSAGFAGAPKVKKNASPEPSASDPKRSLVAGNGDGEKCPFPDLTGHSIMVIGG